MNLEKIIGM